MTECWLRRFSHRPCDGRMDPAHLLPKQMLKREISDDPAFIWHHSVWRHACRRHHGDFDNRVLRVPRAAVPAATEAFAKTFGLGSHLDRIYGPL